MPSVDTVRREGVRQPPMELDGFRLRTVSHGNVAVVTHMEELEREASRGAKGRHSGQGKGRGKGGKGKDRREPGSRPHAMDSAYDRPDYGVSACFVFCLCLYLIWSGFFSLGEEALRRIHESELYEKISKELGFILRHSGWTHADKSLSVFELMAAARFRFPLSAWGHDNCMKEAEPVFPVVHKSQLPNWCEHSLETVNMLIPLAFTLVHNMKGRYQLGILSTAAHQRGEKLVDSRDAWIRPTGITVEERKALASKYKQFKAARVFVQAVSGHSGAADIPPEALKIEVCQLSDLPDSLVHMTEFRHLRSITTRAFARRRHCGRNQTEEHESFALLLLISGRRQMLRSYFQRPRWKRIRTSNSACQRMDATT